jgi:uncharacterized Zn finger protein
MSKKRYAPRIPRKASGFRAQDLKALPRGAWGAKGWLRGIEEMRLGARAGRGRMYAEQGQVSSVSVAGTHVEATVLGARPDPYVVRLDFAPVESFKGLSPAEVLERLGEMTVGRILAGEMPTSVDELFSLEDVSLYPVLGKDRFWCSCPDWSKPCKHIAAVLYLLGDVMVRDPSLLLRLRGISMTDSDGDRPFEPVALPLWKGNEKLDDFIARINRRVYRK